MVATYNFLFTFCIYGDASATEVVHVETQYIICSKKLNTKMDN